MICKLFFINRIKIQDLDRKLIILRIFKLMKARNNAFIYSINSQISFLSAEIIFLLNLFINIIIILNSFFKEKKVLR